MNLSLKILAAIVAILLSYLRATGHKHIALQAVDHCFVAWMFACFFFGRKLEYFTDGPRSAHVGSWFYLGIFAVLCTVEVVCFFALPR